MGEERVKLDIGKMRQNKRKDLQTESLSSPGFSLRGVRFYTVLNLQIRVDMRPQQRLKAS